MALASVVYTPKVITGYPAIGDLGQMGPSQLGRRSTECGSIQPQVCKKSRGCGAKTDK
ncbi:hypothetical protein BJX99DRAFT_237902 [Aspergillus californicus]